MSNIQRSKTVLKYLVINILINLTYNLTQLVGRVLFWITFIQIKKMIISASYTLVNSKIIDYWSDQTTLKFWLFTIQVVILI